MAAMQYGFMLDLLVLPFKMQSMDCQSQCNAGLQVVGMLPLSHTPCARARRSRILSAQPFRTALQHTGHFFASKKTNSHPIPAAT